MMRRRLVLGVMLACFVSSGAARAQDSGKPLQFKSGVDEKAQGFVAFLEILKSIAGAVKDTAQGMSKGIDGGPAALAGAGGLIVQGILAAIARSVKEPDVRQLVLAIGERVAGAARAIGEGGFSASALVGHLVSVAEPLAHFALARLPFPDASLRRLFVDGVSGILAALREPAAFKQTYLDNPWAMLTAALGSVREFVRDKLGGLVRDPRFGPERDLLVGTVDAVFELLLDDTRRKGLLSGKGGARPLLELLVGVAKPYLSARLGGLVAGSGLEAVLDLALSALFGPNGPVLQGAAFFQTLSKSLAANPGALLGDVLGALSTFLEAQLARAGRGPMVTGLLRGLLGVVRSVFTAKGGIAGLVRGGAAAILARVGEVVGPLVEAFAPKTQQSAALDFVRTVTLGATQALAKAADLAKKPVTALRALAAIVSKAAQAALTPALAKLPLEPSLRTLIGKGVATLFRLLSGEGTAPGSAGLVKALREGAALLLPLVRAQLIKGLPAVARPLAEGLIAELGRLVAEPQRLRALHGGKVPDVLGLLFGVLARPAIRVLAAALPPALRTAAAPLLGEVATALAQPARLKALLARPLAGWLNTLKTTGVGLLRHVLSLVPAAPKAALESALARVSAALVNVAALTSQLAAAARTALDQTLSALALQVPNAVARELALGVTSLLRDLFGAGAASNALRASPSKVLASLLSAGARAFTQALGDVVPEGATRSLMRLVVDFVGGLASAPKGLADALQGAASGALSRVASILATTIRTSARATIADPAAATLVDALFEVGVRALLEPNRWAALVKGGVESLLASAVPIFRDFLTAAVGRGLGDGPTRGFIESLLRAAASMFASDPSTRGGAANAPAAKVTVAPAAQPGVTRLVRFGLTTIKNLVERLIEGAGLPPSVASAVSGLFTWLSERVSQPAVLAATLRQRASELLSKALASGQALLTGMLADSVRDAPLRTLVTGSLSALGAALTKALAGGPGANLGASVKALVLGAIGPLAQFFRGKLVRLFGAKAPAILTTFVGEAYDGLVGFATEMLKAPGAWQKHMGAAGKGLLTKVAKWAFDVLARAVTPAIQSPALRGLVTRLLSAVGAQLSKFDELTRALRSPAGAARLLLPQLVAIVKPLIDEELVARLPAGLLREVAGAAVTEGLAFVGDVDALMKVPGLKLPDVLQKVVAFLKARVVPPIVRTLKLGAVVKKLIEVGLDRLAGLAKPAVKTSAR